jgi:hypothetical protein
VRYWHEWFVIPEDEEPIHQSEAEIRIVAGAGHQEDDKPLHLRKKLPPRCAKCKQFMGFNSGMHLMITQEWRVHIKCFVKVVEEHLEDGEVIDLATGQIIEPVDPIRPEDN